jgi:serine/threonine protein kinase/tetratricopeptide (TPR) repeat protein
MPEHQPQVDEVFDEALRRAAGQDRARYLDEACGGDLEVRRRVERLLRAVSEAGSFLETPAQDPSPTVDQPIAETPGTQIGPYKLLEQIGEGGMGSVWMAQQSEPVRRLVAVKLIKAGMDSRQVIARFEAERQALALMDHANIARVLDAGTTSPGRPYFVMDLVKGVPITKYCDEHHLTPRQRLELFIPVCQAIQHAHQKGIIHRDLKPFNVLVALYDGKPVPKVIDFGVAKAAGQQLTEKTLVTGFGNIVGTLEYMSPEQAEVNQLDIDTRSDIYSLGVLLYELLTGSPPFSRKELTQAGMLEMLRVIREQEPSKPSTKLSTADGLPTLAANRGTEPEKLTKLVRGELDWIVMKALEKDRNRRYESANGFAMDVQRYLADEPVLACPPSASYRLRKLVRRNKRTLAILTVLGMALFIAVGTVTGSVGWVMRDREARQVKLDGDFALALERAELVGELGKRIEAQAALEHAEVLGREATPDVAVWERLMRLKARLHAEAQDDAFLDRFEEIRLQEQSLVDPEKNTFIAESAYPSIRATFQQYGIEVGVTPYAEVLARIQGRPKAVQLQLLAALEECFRVAPRDDAAAREWLIAVLNAADDNPWRVQVRKAVRDGNTQALLRLAKEVDVSQQPPSFLITVVRLLARGEPVRRDLGRRVQRAYAGDFWANHRLGADLSANGRPAEAIPYYTAALALRPKNPGVYLNRALALEGIQRLDEALADLDQAVKLAPNYAIAWRVRGRILGKKGDPQGAIDSLKQALAHNPKDATAHSNLGNAFFKQGKVEEAKAEFRAAAAAFEEVVRLKPADGDLRYSWGLFQVHAEQWDAAVAAFDRATALKPDSYWPWYCRAVTNLKVGNVEEYRRTCAAMLARLGGTKDPQAAARVVITCVIAPDAVQDATRLVPIAELGAKAWSGNTRIFGAALYRARRFEEALQRFRELQTEKTDDPWESCFLAMTYHRLGRREDARRRLDAIIAWREASRHVPNDSPIRMPWSTAIEMSQLVAETEELVGTP